MGSEWLAFFLYPSDAARLVQRGQPVKLLRFSINLVVVAQLKGMYRKLNE